MKSVPKIRKRKGGPQKDGIVAGENMIGKTYGYLLVLSEIAPTTAIIYGDGYLHRQRRMMCICICGKEHPVRASGLRNGGTTSCGCKQSEGLKLRISTHGMSKKTEYRIWSDMRQRCQNKNTPYYKYYGGRGIKVCRRWAKFENFFQDMGPRPSMKHSLDRWPNKNGNYTLRNCRWATQEQQNNNKRNNVLLDFFGEKLTMKEVANKLEIKYISLVSRVKLGWSIQEIANTPIKKYKK